MSFGARPLTLGGDGMGSLEFTRSLVLYVILDAYYLSKRGIDRHENGPCSDNPAVPHTHLTALLALLHFRGRTTLHPPTVHICPLGQPQDSMRVQRLARLRTCITPRGGFSTRALGLGRRLTHVAQWLARRLSDRSVDHFASHPPSRCCS